MSCVRLSFVTLRWVILSQVKVFIKEIRFGRIGFV